MTTLDDVRFALIAIEESRRDVYCKPQQTAGVQALVDELGLPGAPAHYTRPYLRLRRSPPPQAEAGGSLFAVD